ncbi:MAG: hypothetical protein WCI04_04335 [archaeon]
MARKIPTNLSPAARSRLDPVGWKEFNGPNSAEMQTLVKDVKFAEKRIANARRGMRTKPPLRGPDAKKYQDEMLALKDMRRFYHEKLIDGKGYARDPFYFDPGQKLLKGEALKQAHRDKFARIRAALKPTPPFKTILKRLWGK